VEVLAMPLYEIVLRYSDRDEIRLTDRDPLEDGQVRINGAVWPIIATREGSTKRVARRYIVAAPDGVDVKRPDPFATP
jgi:hypothetical protein